MMHTTFILMNITAALAVAFVGGFVAQRLKVPAVVGYLLAGVAISPFTPGFVGNTSVIEQLANLGIIFLLFGVGLHFSLRDLWAVRETAIPGALLQMTIATVLGTLLTHLWGWSLASGIVLGLALSIASTVVLLRNLMDQGLLNTSHGQVALGWLVLEDLATVFILVLLPALFTNSSEPLWQSTGLALLKAGVFAFLMLFVGARVIPWFLLQIAHLRSRELFIVAVVVITVGTALGAATLFGVSLALGAFLAGVVINQSALSHQVEADIFSFRETFTILFFVSIGMLVNPLFLLHHLSEVLLITVVIVLGKFCFTLLLGLLFPRPAYTMLVVAAGLSQIGEFSFLLGQEGIALGLLTQERYSLLLAGALFSITLNPFVFRALPWVERCLQAFPLFWRILDRHGPLREPITETLRDHVVVIGYGRVGRHLVDVLGQLGMQRLVVELDAGRVAELERQEIPTLFGDAANSEILTHVHLEQTRAVVVTVPNESSGATMVATVHDQAPQVPIIARAATQKGIHRLFALGASAVIQPEMEGGLEMMRETLARLGYEESEIQTYTDAVRRDHYNTSVNTRTEQQALSQLRHPTPKSEEK